MAETRKVEIGLGIGQVVSTRLEDDELAKLRSAIEAGTGWHDIQTDDGTLAINVAAVIFVRVPGSAHSVGFGGS